MNTQCPRCLKFTDGVHTCNPTEGWAKLEAEITELRSWRKLAEHRHQINSPMTLGHRLTVSDSLRKAADLIEAGAPLLSGGLLMQQGTDEHGTSTMTITSDMVFALDGRQS